MTEPSKSGDTRSIEPLLAALVDVLFRDGRHEVARATGKRGTVRLSVELTLGNGGVPLHSSSSLVFEEKRMIADSARGEPREQA